MIKNNEEYLSRMTKTFMDKAFFLKYIPENIKTIIDYGCSDGSFLSFIRGICGDRYNYIGIEQNKTFRDLAIKRGFKVYSEEFEISSIPNDKQKEYCICLSSVLHEICHYNGENVSKNLMTGLVCSNFGAIAVRDMSISFKNNLKSDIVSSGMIEFLNQAIMNCPNQFHDFVEIYGIHTVKDMFHFLLKYMYKENWEREVRECYLWKSNSFDNYTSNVFTKERGWKTIGEKFQIPYLEDKWESDFNPNHDKNLSILLENTYTHFKAIYTKE